MSVYGYFVWFTEFISSMYNKLEDLTSPVPTDVNNAINAFMDVFFPLLHIFLVVLLFGILVPLTICEKLPKKAKFILEYTEIHPFKKKERQDISND